MHNIKSGLKALEAVSYAFVSQSLPLVLLLSVIMFRVWAEMNSRMRCLSAGNIPRTVTCNTKCHICSRAQEHMHMYILHRQACWVIICARFLVLMILMWFLSQHVQHKTFLLNLELSAFRPSRSCTTSRAGQGNVAISLWP